jgi:hypothetical protein
VLAELQAKAEAAAANADQAGVRQAMTEWMEKPSPQPSQETVTPASPVDPTIQD